MSEKKNDSCRLGKVGGEAIIEGVMMKSPERHSIAVRKEDGSIVYKNKENKTIKTKYKILGIPLVRGITNFIETLLLSYRTLDDGTNMLGIMDEEEPSKFEKWLEKKLGKNAFMSVLMGISMVFALILVAFMFVFLPVFITNGLGTLLNVELGFWRNVIEGVLKIVIFVLYLYLASLIPDMKRVFQYHGAEHKSVFCFESGEELTVENVKKFKRFHPRCGTALMFVIILISILVSAIIPAGISQWLRMALKLLTLPLAVGIGYEYVMYAGKHDNPVTRFFSAPGLWMQRITTKEPDDSQIEIAITALKLSMPSVFPDFAPENGKMFEEETKEADNDEKNG